MRRVSGIIEVVTGGGKSYMARELCRWWDGPAVVSAPVLRLVDQLHEDIEDSATWDGRGKTMARVIIACTPSLKTVPFREGTLYIADEAHMTNNAQFEDGMEAVRPVARVGLTATPFGPDDRTSLVHWDEIIYRYGFDKALRDGVIVPWRIVPWTGGEVPLDDACVEMIRGAEGPGLVNADSIEDATSFHEKLQAAGVKAAIVHSKMGKGVYKDTVKALLAGDLDCAVHVNMLAVGVNIPPLRWLCARRNVQSKTRFPQEVGRVLRSSPGKTHAVIYDPCDLFATMSLTNDADIGGSKKPEPYMQPDDMPPLDGLDEEERKKVVRKTAALDPDRHAIRVLNVAIGTAYGVTSAPGEWRQDEPTDNQLNALARAAARFGQSDAPEHARRSLRRCYSLRRYLTKGEVSDILSIMLTLSAKGWNDTMQALVPAPQEE